MKKCKNCKQVFDQVNFNQKYCLNKDCVQIWLKSEQEKQWIKKKVKMKAEFYKNTTANPITGVTCQAFKFIVAGGETTTVLTPPVIVINDLTLANLKDDLYYNDNGAQNLTIPISKRINVFTYSALTGAGAFVNDNYSLIPIAPYIRKPSAI